ncbi:MAG TPA: NAD(P)H-dependent oxidoreductase [Acidocella sp.]|jgi:FMN-dependent NADH-azoreductase|uniref:FMN-dependent NADH-azoreductase n=1 Tax=Acidocella sp. TaxID=50710 RepID=UPI002BA41C17|nr:NAD(P)H-dependent oxidoreductase [Acidocella sp.]HVE21512.1 NAD(P)H-dependent oxidoreductase [Acidocella sp.]
MKLLHIDSSILGSNSISRKLTASIVQRQKALHPGLEVTYLDLAAAAPMHLSPAHIGAMFGTAPTDPAVIADIAASAPFIDQLFAADIIVIGAPMYNFAPPSQLKAWIDRVLAAGKTFRYGADGVPVGLVSGKKVFIASSRGGAYHEGPLAALDHQEAYLKAALGFIGITDVTVIRAETMAVPDLKPAALAAAEAQIAALVA